MIHNDVLILCLLIVEPPTYPTTAREMRRHIVSMTRYKETLCLLVGDSKTHCLLIGRQQDTFLLVGDEETLLVSSYHLQGDTTMFPHRES